MKSQKQKTKSKVTRFFETIGLALAVVWISPVIAYEGIKEHFEKKREERKNGKKKVDLREFLGDTWGRSY
jgi:hypothetical protein